jgi:hypothetical protein
VALESIFFLEIGTQEVVLYQERGEQTYDRKHHSFFYFISERRSSMRVVGESALCRVGVSVPAVRRCNFFFHSPTWIDEILHQRALPRVNTTARQSEKAETRGNYYKGWKHFTKTKNLAARKISMYRLVFRKRRFIRMCKSLQTTPFFMFFPGTTLNLFLVNHARSDVRCKNFH